MSKNNKDAVIIEGFRTPFVKSGQDFQNMPAEELGAWILRELLERTQIALNEIEEVILANIINPISPPNIARVIALRAGLSPSISAITAQSMDTLDSVISSVIKIKSGLTNTLISGGVESMSHQPIFFSSKLTKIIKKIIESNNWKDKVKQILFLRPSDMKFQFADRKLFINSVSSLNQAQTAEILSEEFHFSRTEQDEFALMSFQKACLAQKNGKWKEEIVPIFPPADFKLVDKDTALEKKLSMHCLSELQPCFDLDYGTITSGNSSFTADGAALLLIMSREKATALGYQPIVSIHSFASIGVEPRKQGLGPVYASEKVLKQVDLQIKDINLFEINEAFSAQTLACLKAFESSVFAEKYLGQKSAMGEVNPKKCNVNGGALALGDPLSATGSRMILSLMKEMKRQQAEWGLVATGICNGQSSALILKNEN